MYKINVYVLGNIELLLFSFMYRAINCTIINLACTIFLLFTYYSEDVSRINVCGKMSILLVVLYNETG